jgi:hypothetical protein
MPIARKISDLLVLLFFYQQIFESRLGGQELTEESGTDLGQKRVCAQDIR